MEFKRVNVSRNSTAYSASYHLLTTCSAFFIPPAYPDSTEPPIMVLNNKTRVLKWDEANATLSEASVINIYLPEAKLMLMYQTGES